MTEPPNLEPRTRAVNFGGSPVVQRSLCTPRSSTDKKSIYIGNLPDGTTEAELMNIFGGFGQIKGVNIIRKPMGGMYL